MSLGYNPVSIVEDRALMLEKVRLFFKERGILEVDTPILSKFPSLNTHIALMQTEITDSIKGYLHSSPEYGMKKLLCKIKKNIYQLCHVFRQNELGSFHRPEFTMIEWYLLDKSLQELIEQTLDLIHLFIPLKGYERKTYKEIFEDTFSINPFDLSISKLLQLTSSYGFDAADKEEALTFLWDVAEKKLGQTMPCIVVDFPASPSQLAKTHLHNDYEYSLRFEIYYQGIELANGYDELLDPHEHRKRFETVRLEKEALGQASLPIDESLLSLLKSGLPNCVGVAVGFDRLMMLRHNTKNIENALPLSWEET